MAIKIHEHRHVATFYDQETGVLWQQDQLDFMKPPECAEGAWPTVEAAMEAFFDGQVNGRAEAGQSLERITSGPPRRSRSERQGRPEPQH